MNGWRIFDAEVIFIEKNKEEEVHIYLVFGYSYIVI